MNPNQTSMTSAFDAIATQWWDEKGPFRHLHQMNPTRLSFILKNMKQHFGSIENLSVLDVGCGGGLLCEPLARLGANVTGIDETSRSIDIASQHATEQGLTISYACQTLADHQQTDKAYDVITALEIIEHVDDPQDFIRKCSDLLKPGGLLFISTLNRTWKSYLFAIVGAEYILRILPVGTHEWQKFMAPHEIVDLFYQHAIAPLHFSGMVYSPFSQTWRLDTDMDVNYIGVGRKAFQTDTSEASTPKKPSTPKAKKPKVKITS